METINTHNVARVQELRTLQRSQGKVLSLAFSPDSRLLALGCNDNNIELWRVDDGTLMGILPFGFPGAEGVVFYPNGNTVIGVSGNAPRFSIWDANNLTLIKDFAVPIGHQPGCVAITPTGKTLATGGFDGNVYFWEWNNGDQKLRSILPAHQALPGDYAFVNSLAFSPDGLYLATGCSNGEFRLWRIGFDLLPQLHAEVLGTGSNVASLSFNGSGTMLAASHWNGNLYLVNVSDGHLLIKLSEPPSATNTQMSSCAFAPTEQLIVSCQASALTGSALLVFWDASTKNLLLAKAYLCDKVKFSPNGKLLVVIRNLQGEGGDIPTIWGIRKLKPQIPPITPNR